MPAEFLRMELRHPKWVIICPTLDNRVLFESENRDVCDYQLSHYVSILRAYDKWRRLHEKPLVSHRKTAGRH